MSDESFDTVVSQPSIVASRSGATTKATPLDVDVIYRDSSSAFSGIDLTSRVLWGSKKLPAPALNYIFVPHHRSSVSEYRRSFRDYVSSRVRHCLQFSRQYPQDGFFENITVSDTIDETLIAAFAFNDIVRPIRAEERYTHAAVFQCVEPLEEHEARAQRLFAELDQDVSAGDAIGERLRALQQAAKEDEEPFSIDALEAFVLFAKSNPNLPLPDLTLAQTGGIVAEWRNRNLGSVVVYFVSPINVQYVVKRSNPSHSELAERLSASTTVDRLAETLAPIAPFLLTWPIAA